MALKIEKILCPIDLNNECSGALNFPLSLARHFNAKIIFCYVAPSVAAAPESHHNRLNKLVEDTLD